MNDCYKMEKNVCPVCMKKGVKSRVRAYQINFTEGIWACESDKCHWPLGYQKPIFFQRDALSCDWTKNLPNPPRECVSESEFLLYTPPMTPAEGELCKESTDIIGTISSSQLPALNKLDNKNESAASSKNCNDLQWLIEMGILSTEENLVDAKMKDEDLEALLLETDPKNFQDTDSTTFPSISKYSDTKCQTQDLNEYLHSTVKDIVKDVDNTCNYIQDLDLNKKRSDTNVSCFKINNEYSEESKQNESKKMQLNNPANSLDNNVGISSSDSVGEADLMNLEIMLQNISDDNYSIKKYDNNDDNDDWLKSLLS